MQVQRLDYIDNLKGFVILLVVVGHIIQFMYAPDSFDRNVLFRYIYSFHMALFMMLSGFTTKLDTDISIEVIKRKTSKRAKRLLLPFLTLGGGEFCII